MSETTTINVTVATKSRLAARGKKGQTYEEIIAKLLTDDKEEACV